MYKIFKCVSERVYWLRITNTTTQHRSINAFDTSEAFDRMYANFGVKVCQLIDITLSD